MNSYKNLGSPDFPNEFSDAQVTGDKRATLMQALADGKVEVVPGPAIPVAVEASETPAQESPTMFYRYTGATHAQYIGGLPARDLTDADLTGDQRPLLFAAIALGIYDVHAVDAQPVASAEDAARVKAEQAAALKALQDAEEAARLAELKAAEEAEAARLQKLAEDEAAAQLASAQQALEAAKQSGLSAKKAKEIAALIDAGQVAEAQAALDEFSPKK